MLLHDKQIKSFLEVIFKYGITNFVISPGSRSTPLVNNLIKNKDLFNLNIILDERSAGFFALGMAKKTNLPTILICTSGSATLNYSPAVAEAYYSNTPLIIITADRPMSYRDTGANQTLNQSGIYANNISWFYDVPVAGGVDFDIEINNIQNVAYKAIEKSCSLSSPVHINWQFDEPFTNNKVEKINCETKSEIQENFQNIKTNNQEFLDCIKNKNGLILVGSTKDKKENIDDILLLSQNTNFPIIADVLSNIRTKTKGEKTNIITTADIICRNKGALNDIEVVIHIGALPVSKFVINKLLKAKNHIFIEKNNTLSHGFFPIGIHLKNTVKSYVDATKNIKIHPNNKKWTENILQINAKVRKNITQAYNENEEFFYKSILLENLTKKTTLIAGNSLSVRVLDIVLDKSEVKIIGNRGLSGIDGNIAMAIGYSNRTTDRVVLDIGDLTFLYDNSSLIFANKYAKNLTIIINNNSGGQIFNLLPQQKDLSKEYDEWFITPHTNISIKKLADTYNCFYEKVENPTKMKKALQNSFAKNGVSIIEVLQNSDYKQFNEKIKILVDKITINS